MKCCVIRNFLMNSNCEAKYFEQDIDHTGELEGTFQQLYYETLREAENISNLKFLFIGGENALSTGSVVMNFMSQLADQFLADKYALEHRYYGQSQPFRNTSVESLKYLTVDQSLEDIKNFIEVVNNYTPDVCNKWILFGGSYAGNLAAWARMMYPELIFGAVSSSAPVQVEFNFKKYLEITSKLIEEKDAECKSTIKEGMKMLVYTFNTKAGKEKLATKFKMCDPPKHQFDKYSLTSFIVELFTDAVEFNTKVVNGDRLSLLCIDLKNRKGNSLEKLASLVADHYATGRDCFNYNYNSNQDLFKTEINEYNFERQWYYQKCTELGYFQTTGSSEQPFTHSLPLFYYTKLCKDAFGKKWLALSGYDHGGGK
ncbi:putative serine protease K12H4.7 isoform X3 [Rhodnius prolixus]|uniref:putative serine protease K12H4.7 isoform X3 n=1 Tax=Rhodnius prolixus TaxID=13249 RepID=UPI003D189A5F